MEEFCHPSVTPVRRADVEDARPTQNDVERDLPIVVLFCSPADLEDVDWATSFLDYDVLLPRD